MIEKYFEKDGIAQTGLTPNITIKNDTDLGNIQTVVTNTTMVELGNGYYRYAGDLPEGANLELMFSIGLDQTDSALVDRVVTEKVASNVSSGLFNSRYGGL